MQRTREHLEAVNETYFQHMAHAGGFGFKMIGAGAACLIHGLIPSLCCTTGSRAVTELHDSMVVNRIKSDAANDSQN